MVQAESTEIVGPASGVSTSEGESPSVNPTVKLWYIPSRRRNMASGIGGIVKTFIVPVSGRVIIQGESKEVAAEKAKVFLAAKAALSFLNVDSYSINEIAVPDLTDLDKAD